VRHIRAGSREDLGGLCPRERSWVGVPGGDPFADVVFQRDNAFVNAAFEQLIDVASRRLKLRRLHPQLRNQLLALFFGIVRH
jgi:hypothetical protein